jgi:hypothetical protein
MSNVTAAQRSILIPIGWSALAVIAWLIGFSARANGGDGWFVFGTFVGLVGFPWLTARAAKARRGAIGARSAVLAALAAVLVVVLGISLHSARVGVAQAQSASVRVPVGHVDGDESAVRAVLHYDGKYEEMSIDITYDTSDEQWTPELDARVQNVNGETADCAAFRPWRSDGDETTVTQSCLIAWDAKTLRGATSVDLIDPS